MAKKRRRRIKMNAFYKVAIILLIIAVTFMMAAVFFSNAELINSEWYFYDFSVYCGWASSGLALLGIIFACFSKPKKKNKMVIMTVSKISKD